MTPAEDQNCQPIQHPQVGVSGFRIDLAVVDPDGPGSYLAGVECDGATYHRAAGARDRDRLRQLVLERLGWRVLRIWSTDWWTNAARECDRLHVTLQAALADGRAERGKLAQTSASTGGSAGLLTGVPAGPAVGDPEPAPRIGPTAESPDAPAAAPAEINPALLATNIAPAVLAANAAPAMATVDAAASVPAADATPGVPAADAVKFYEDGYRSVLRAIIAAELARSGPLRIDRLTQRVARLHGFQRTGREIQDRVAAAIPRSCRRTEDSAGVFVWPPGADPTAWDRFPCRQDAEMPLDPAELPLEVLTVLARVCLTAQADHEAALQLMRDGCGLTRFREPSRLRCLEAIARV